MTGKLSLPGASDGGVRAPAGHCRSIRAGLAVGGLVDRRNLVVLHVDERLLASVAARASLGRRLVVGRDVERNKEDEVRADDGHSRERREFLSGTLAHVRSPREVCRREVRVGCEVDEA